MERDTNENVDYGMHRIAANNNAVPAEQFFKKLPELAIAGDEQSVDRIAYELLNLLVVSAGADIGQINLLPMGGRVEKVCVVKDGRPWLRADMGLHLYNPSKGFTGRVINSGKTFIVEDIWAEEVEQLPNPFLQIAGFMDYRYLDEIKKPVASSLFLPIKRNNEVFCTIELSRYRSRQAFNSDDQLPLDEFALQYGSIIINYLLDTKNRITLNTAYHKLNNISRLVASSGKIDYSDAVAAYQTLSAADLGFAFFRRGEGHECHALYVVAWHREEIREICFPEFQPSEDSILCNSSKVSYPVEGNRHSRRLERFRDRIEKYEGIKRNDQQFLLDVIDKIRSYVVYPLHMLNQDLGAVHLASSRNDFCKYLHMSPFLSLYNSLLKSFLLNERVSDLLSQISLKIHNPGFYCLGGLKTALIQANQELMREPKIISAFNCLDDLLSELHEKGKNLTSRTRNIHLEKWLRAWINQKRSHYSSIEIKLEVTDYVPSNCHVRANYEHLETLFENLLANSMRAIAQRQSIDRKLMGEINIRVSKQGDEVSVQFQDNGESYKTVSGRGTPQMRSIMQELNGSFERDKYPYCVYLSFPYKIKEDKEVHHEN